MRKILLFTGGFFLFLSSLLGEDYLTFGFDNHYTIVERQDIRQRENGKYKGFIFREMRGVLEATSLSNTESTYTGSFFIYRKMTRNGMHISKAVDEVIPSVFRLNKNGRMSTDADTAVPPIQNFPVLPRDPVQPGDSWRDYAIRIVDPTAVHPTRVKIYCEYVYQGIKKENGYSRHLITAQYALRYKAGQDAFGDPSLKEIHGKHLVDIFIPVDGPGSIFMRDKIEDQYTYFDGKKIEESGIILTWFDDISGMDRGSLKKKVQQITLDEEYEDITIEERPEGITLQIQNINFYPDEDRILPGQENKIRTIAKILKQAEGHTFLVTGHTADVGTKESQQILSEQRAKVISDMLMEMGIPSEKLLYLGLGGTEPIAPNDIEENMAKNRRVEITILEGTR